MKAHVNVAQLVC